SYEEALAIAPGHLPALVQLAALHADDPAALAATLERIASSTKDRVLGARVLVEAASLHEGPLADPDAATRLLQAAHRADPDDRAIARRLWLHLERRGAREPLCDLLREEAERGGPEGAIAAYRLARLHLRAGEEE